MNLIETINFLNKKLNINNELDKILLDESSVCISLIEKVEDLINLSDTNSELLMCKVVEITYSQERRRVIDIAQKKLLPNEWQTFENILSWLEIYIIFISFKKALGLIISKVTLVTEDNIKRLNNKIYEVDDSEVLTKLFTTIGRKVIDNKISKKYLISKQHIEEQLEGLRLKQKYVSPVNNIQTSVKELNSKNAKSIINHVTGFDTNLNEKQMGELYNGLIKNSFLEASRESFFTIFTIQPTSIKWIDKGTTRHESNKQTIFELLYLLSESRFIVLPDTLATNQDNLYRKLEAIFPDIKNFPQSSGTGKSQQNTHRKKLLKEIVKSLILIES